MTFRRRLFFTSLLTAAVTLAAATALISWSLRQNLEERIERATKITVGGAGHIIKLEWPEEFDRIVLGFLRDGS